VAQVLRERWHADDQRRAQEAVGGLRERGAIVASGGGDDLGQVLARFGEKQLGELRLLTFVIATEQFQVDAGDGLLGGLALGLTCARESPTSGRTERRTSTSRSATSGLARRATIPASRAAR